MLKLGESHSGVFLRMANEIKHNFSATPGVRVRQASPSMAAL